MCADSSYSQKRRQVAALHSALRAQRWRKFTEKDLLKIHSSVCFGVIRRLSASSESSAAAKRASHAPLLGTTSRSQKSSRAAVWSAPHCTALELRSGSAIVKSGARSPHSKAASREVLKAPICPPVATNQKNATNCTLSLANPMPQSVSFWKFADLLGRNKALYS